MGYSSNELVNTAETATNGALFLFRGQTIVTIVATVGSIVIARLMWPELYGMYSLSLIVPGFLLLLAHVDFAVPGINALLVPRDPRSDSSGHGSCTFGWSLA